MRARIPASTLKRLEALEQARGQRKVVALFPEFMPGDECGAIASNMQAELKANIKKDCPPEYDKGDLYQIVFLASC